MMQSDAKLGSCSVPMTEAKAATTIAVKRMPAAQPVVKRMPKPAAQPVVKRMPKPAAQPAANEVVVDLNNGPFVKWQPMPKPLPKAMPKDSAASDQMAMPKDSAASDQMPKWPPLKATPKYK